MPLQRYTPTLPELTLIDMYIPISQASVASISARSLALDGDMGPHVLAPNCTDCPGLLAVSNADVQLAFPGALLSHFAAASADLSRFGGSPARVIASSSLIDRPSNPSHTSFLVAFKADWNSTSSRYGIVIQWNPLVHNDRFPIEIAGPDGTALRHIWVDPSQEGLTTVVFTA